MDRSGHRRWRATPTRERAVKILPTYQTWRFARGLQPARPTYLGASHGLRPQSLPTSPYVLAV
eukprot:4521734-Prymnesium_polylepis.1